MLHSYMRQFIPEWRWQQGELSDTTGTPVSADNCTAITWNTAADDRVAVNAAAEAADAHKLVNADLYNTAYENYQSRKAEAESPDRAV